MIISRNISDIQGNIQIDISVLQEWQKTKQNKNDPVRVRSASFKNAYKQIVQTYNFEETYGPRPYVN